MDDLEDKLKKSISNLLDNKNLSALDLEVLARTIRFLKGESLSSDVFTNTMLEILKTSMDKKEDKENG